MEDNVLLLLKTIVSSLVDSPNEVIFRCVEQEDKVIYYVIPKDSEVGQVIGQKGTLGHSIRTIIKAVARKNNGKNVYLDVQDSSQEPF